MFITFRRRRGGVTFSVPYQRIVEVTTVGLSRLAAKNHCNVSLYPATGDGDIYTVTVAGSVDYVIAGLNSWIREDNRSRSGSS